MVAEKLIDAGEAILGPFCLDAAVLVWEYGFAHIRHESDYTIISFSPKSVTPGILLATFAEILDVLPQKAFVIRTEPNVYSLHFGIRTAFGFAWKFVSGHDLPPSSLKQAA